jgi:hypothetical protein
MKPVRLSLRTCSFIAAMVVVTGATDAFATDPVAADALFQAGKQLIADKKFADACTKFDASYKLDPTLGTLLNLADCYEKASRFATSWSTWGKAMEQAQRDKDARADYAKERRDALVPKLPRVVINAYGMMPGIDVFWDGNKVAQGVFGTEMPSDALDHKLVVRRDDGVVLLQKDVHLLEDGKKTNVSIDVVALNREHPRGVLPEEPSPSAHRNAQSSAGLVIGSVGLAALLTAGGLELGALLKRNEADAPNACVNNFCTPKGIDAIATARTYADAGQWIGVAGLVVFSVGATLFVAAPSAPAAASKPTSANVHGSATRPSPFLSPSAMWWSPWVAPVGGGIVVGGAL